MKKTLVALAVAAFATSASALTIYEQDGSKVSFDGSLRLRLDNEKAKVGKETTKRAHTNLHNDGSRFGVKLQHNIAEDFYALGRVEFRFNGKSTDVKDGKVVPKGGVDGFGDLYAHRAYVGLGSKQYGELTFGRQVLIGDEIAQSGFDYAYGTFNGTLTAESNSAVRYDYKGIEGLQIGLDYRFAEKRDGRNEVPEGEKKSGYGVGVVYSFAPAEGQSATVAAGYTRDNFVTGTSAKHHRDAYQVGAKYTVDALTLAADYAGSFEKDGKETERLNGFRVGAKYQVTPAVSVFTNYGRAVEKTKQSGTTVEKTTYNKFMLGTDYKLHKNVVTYLEGGLVKTKTGDVKSTDTKFAVGLRVNW